MVLQKRKVYRSSLDYGEWESLKAVSHLQRLRAKGPAVSSPFLEGNHPLDSPEAREERSAGINPAALSALRQRPVASNSGINRIE
jgi:hypothetical protein